MNNKSIFATDDGRNLSFTFFLITTLFFLWGFCNGMIDVMDKHFQEELHLTLAQSANVQWAHYLGYFLMAMPAGWLANKLGWRNRSKKTMKTYCFFITGLFLVLFSPPAQALTAVGMSCDAHSNPLGIDNPAPLLSWKLESPARNESQTAYQVLVASDTALLEKNQGNIWDSGKVSSPHSLRIPYAGKPLASSQTCYWKVRVWDQNNQPGEWSAISSWTMGLLRSEDWGEAQWIGAINTPPEPPGVVLKGFHSKPTASPSTNEWVQITLDQDQPVEKIRIYPVSHEGINGFGFPKRFKIEVSPDLDFHAPKTVLDQTGSDFPNPGKNFVEFPLDGSKIRALRITEIVPCEYPKRKPGEQFLWALSEVHLLASGRNVALKQKVTAASSVEGYGWGVAALTSGKNDEHFLSEMEKEKIYTMRLRRDLAVRPGLQRALFHVCGLGHYALEVNGKEPSEGRPLTPGWTNYKKTVLYDTLDLTPLLKEGANTLGVTLDGGMYFSQKNRRYSTEYTNYGPLVLRGKLELQYKDGTREIVITDGSWSAGPSPILFSAAYGGEDYDARREQPGWSTPSFHPTPDWKPAVSLSGPTGILRGKSYHGWLVRQVEPLEMKSFKDIRPSITVYDFGQNASTYPEMVVSGPEGSSVRLTPSELTGADGAIKDTMCGEKAFYSYTLSGRGAEHWRPRFFYRGARYLKVEKFPASPGGELPKIESIRQQVIHAQTPVAGTFSCSNELFNRIYDLVRWAQRSNMVSVTTDCPHREKRGWLEEDHLNGPALRYNFTLGPLFGKIVQDMMDAQTPEGLVPDIAPEYTVFRGGFRDSPEWGSSALFVPWQSYLFDGNQKDLERAYEMMKRYEAYLLSKSKDLIVDHGLGDWYDIGPKGPGPAQLTPKAVTATAYFYKNAWILAQTARLLGKPEDEKTYSDLAARIRAKFIANFFNPDTAQVSKGSQCANAIALVMGLVPESARAAVLANLVKDVQEKNITAGDVGYVYLLRALADAGRSDVIYAINNQSEKPGYGYQLKRGATSLTESWSGGNSQNHFMLGQINEWFFHDVSGIQPDSTGPGFSRFHLKPTLPGDLQWVKASYQSLHGTIAVDCRREAASWKLTATIPANTRATVHLPTAQAASIKESGKPLKQVPEIKIINTTASEETLLEVGSGRYEFEVAR